MLLLGFSCALGLSSSRPLQQLFARRCVAPHCSSAGSEDADYMADGDRTAARRAARLTGAEPSSFSSLFDGILQEEGDEVERMEEAEMAAFIEELSADDDFFEKERSGARPARGRRAQQGTAAERARLWRGESREPSTAAERRGASRDSRARIDRSRPDPGSTQLQARPLYELDDEPRTGGGGGGGGRRRRGAGGESPSAQPLYRPTPEGRTEMANLGGTLVTLLPTKVGCARGHWC